MAPLLIFIALLIIAILVGVTVFLMTLRRRLSGMAARKIESMITAAVMHSDPRIRILELDKALDTLLSQLGYKGSLGEKLMKASARFSNIDALWAAHKQRNRLAHETGAMATDADVERARHAIHSALKQVSR